VPEKRCPVCQRGISLKEGDEYCGIENEFIHSKLDRLEKLKRILSKMSDSDSIPLCDVCPKENKDAEFFCRNCSLQLCIGCKKKHNKHIKRAKGRKHQIVDITEGFGSEYLAIVLTLDRKKVPKCNHHRIFDLDCYCIQCRRPICVNCIVNEHKDHESTDISTFIAESGAKNQTLILIKDVEKRRQDIETSLHLIGLMETDIQSSLLSQRDQIISISDRLKREAGQQIEQHKQTLLQQLEDKSKEKLDRLAQQRKQLERDLDCLDNSVSFSRSLVKNATDFQFVSHFALITDQLNRLREDESFNQPPVETKHLRLLDLKGALDVSLADRLSSIILVEAPTKISLQPSDAIQRPAQERLKDARTKLDTTQHPETIVQSAPKRSRDGSILLFGSKGNGNAQFNYPWKPTIDPRNNNIIICDTGNNRLLRFDENGNFISSFGTKGQGDGQFDCPSDLDFDSQNRMIVCDRNNHRIQIFDKDRNFVKSFGSKGDTKGKLNQPQGVAIDDKDNIIVCDAYNHRIQIFNKDGNYVKHFGSEGSGKLQFKYPWGVAINQKKEILICDQGNRRIVVKSFEGNTLRIITPPVGVRFVCLTGIAIDRNQRIILTDFDDHKIIVLNSKGKFIKEIGGPGHVQGKFDRPAGVAIDQHNRIVVADSDNHRIQVFSSDVLERRP